MALADRIKEAMGKKTPAELARDAKVTPAAVSQWLDGSTKSLKAEKAALLEAATGYRASWIVTGKGPKTVAEGGEPAPRGTSFMAVTDDERGLLEDFRDILDEDEQRRIAQDVATLAQKSRTMRHKLRAQTLAELGLAPEERLTPADRAELRNLDKEPARRSARSRKPAA